MFSFFGLIFGEKYLIFRSSIIKYFLITKGIKIGDNFTILGIPYVKIRGKSKNIIIGDNVFIGGNIDLRNRENGKIIIENDVKFDNECRLVSANDAMLIIGKGSTIGPRCVFNCGSDVTIGRKVLFSGNVYINSSAHEIKKDFFVRDQGYYHKKVIICDDVFIGANVVINPGIEISKGSVVGSNAVITKDTEEYSINAGVPNKKIGIRK